MYAALGDRDSVEGAVELAVAAAVESVALSFAGARVDGCDAGVAGELGVGAEADLIRLRYASNGSGAAHEFGAYGDRDDAACDDHQHVRNVQDHVGPAEDEIVGDPSLQIDGLAKFAIAAPTKTSEATRAPRGSNDPSSSTSMTTATASGRGSLLW